MMDGNAVVEIAELAQLAGAGVTKVVEVEGRGPFSTVPLHRVPREPMAEPRTLTVSTLEALSVYLTSNRDGLDLDRTTVHVTGPDHVDVISALSGETEQRFTYVTASVRPSALTGALGFRFGEYLGVEALNIVLQSLFVPAYSRPEVLRLLGNVQSDEIGTLQDDGVTQRVAVRAGITLVDRESVPNPVVLAPYRTFPEIVQPASPFVLRVREKGGSVEAALFEADGGAWRLAAIADIAAWLRDRLPEAVVILA